MKIIMETIKLALIFIILIGCIFSMAAFGNGENMETGSSIGL